MQQRSGFTLKGLLVIAALIGGIVVGLLAFFDRSLSGPGPAVLITETTYNGSWKTEPPIELDRELTIEYVVTQRVEVREGLFVRKRGDWEPVVGARVKFTLGGGASSPARLTNGSEGNKVELDVATDADGVASVILYPEGTGPSSLKIHLTIPQGPNGPDPDVKFFTSR